MSSEINETPFGKGLSMSDNLLEAIEQWVIPVYKGEDVASLIADAKDKEDDADELASGGNAEGAADLLRQAALHHDAAVSAYKRVGDGEKFGYHAREAARLRDKATDILNAKHAEGDIANRINKGGDGSGEHDGHPFRGNRYTAGIHSAGRFSNLRERTADWHHGQHLDAAKAHIEAAKAAVAAGHFNQAANHMDEAAYHASRAGELVQSSRLQYPWGDPHTGRMAVALHEAAHSSGEALRQASRDSNHLLSANAARLDARTMGDRITASTGSQKLAHASIASVEAAHNSLNAARETANSGQGDPTYGRQTA